MKLNNYPAELKGGPWTELEYRCLDLLTSGPFMLPKRTLSALIVRSGRSPAVARRTVSRLEDKGWITPIRTHALVSTMPNQPTAIFPPQEVTTCDIRRLQTTYKRTRELRWHDTIGLCATKQTANIFGRIAFQSSSLDQRILLRCFSQILPFVSEPFSMGNSTWIDSIECVAKKKPIHLGLLVTSAAGTRAVGSLASQSPNCLSRLRQYAWEHNVGLEIW